ncbi:Leucine-rich repeat domain, L domain-like [Phytophthora cactorum]|nr:Leucine-rich repeat domain, L domain-like [Phytophthora cactorum]
MMWLQLDLNECWWSSERAMQEIGHIKSLEVLVIRGCQDTSDDGMTSLAELTNLKYFDARHCSKIHSIPTEWTQLEVLLLGYTAFAESDTAVLQYLTKLQELELRKCRIMKSITDNGLMHLIPLHKLQELTICGGNIGDRGVGLISKLTSLTSLNLSQNRGTRDASTMQARQENALRRMEQDYDSRMEEQVEDLRDKMRLLQVDRKSNIDLLESSKQTNKDYIRQLKNENRDLRKALADLKRTTSAGAAGSQSLGLSALIGVTDDADEIASATQQMNKVRKQHDDLRHRVQSQTALLEELKDEVKDLELESKKPSLEDTPETRKIRMLENRLDKAMIKFNEAQSIRKTYEQIVKRLKDERIGFDNQLAAIERALAAKQHDYDELVLLSADAAHARETILLELEKARSQHEDEKRHRDKELREKQQYVKIRLEMTNRLDKREKHKSSVIARDSVDLSYEGESQLKASLMSTMIQQGVAGEEKKEHRSKIDIFESAFRKIKEATGVSDVNEVIQKITSQESTTDNLLNLSKENQARLERLQAEHSVLKARVEELKYSGSGGGHRRKLVDDHEQNLVLASTKLERAKLKYERLAKVLIGVKAGVEHLVDKMESVREDDQVIVVTDETIVEALQESEITLTHLLSQIKLAGAAPSSMDSSSMQKKIEHNSCAHILVARPYNQRIALPGTDGLTAEELEMDDMGGANGGMLLDDTEEALSRDRVKRASSQVIMAQDKKKKRVLKKKFKESGNESSDEEGSAGASINGGSTANQAESTSRGPPTQRTLSPRRNKTRRLQVFFSLFPKTARLKLF